MKSAPEALPNSELLTFVNEQLGGYNRVLGLRIIELDAEHVLAELEVTDIHHQVHGIVHGGVYCGIVETMCSVGALAVAMPRGQTVMGVENHTSFLRAVRSGKLRAVATPVSAGRTMQLWEANIRDDAERLVATGRVRLYCVAPGAQVAGETLAHKA